MTSSAASCLSMYVAMVEPELGPGLGPAFFSNC